MKSVEERLKELPRMAEAAGLQADENLKRRILQSAREKENRGAKTFAVRKLVPVLCALVVIIGGVTAYLPSLVGDASAPQPTNQPLIASVAAGGEMVGGEKLALDVPPGSITIRAGKNPSFRSIWAQASGGNFPLIGVKGRYYRLLTNPTAISESLLGEAIGTVDQFTSEPALAGKNGVCSNTVQVGETVYAVRGMNGAMAAARVNGQLRVFQRVSYGDNALVGSESLSSTLRANRVVALEISGMGAINDTAKAQELMNVLFNNAGYLRAGSGETNQSLLIQLESGLVLQMAVNGERLMACGTWACPEFFEAFEEALQ